MLSVLAVVILASPAVADTVSFAGSGPGVGVNALAAQADFECTANQLIITLINTSPFPTEIPSELLSGVFFDIDGDPTLTPVSVFLAGGSVVLNGVSDPGGEVSGEWAYRGDIAGGYNGANYGLGVNAVDAFGVGDLFTGTNLDGPASPNGMNYGLVSVGGLGPNVNLPMLSEPLVWNAVVITLNHNGDLSCDDIYNVGFQYGTSATQPFIPGDPGDPPFPPTVIPEPASASLLLMGLAGLALRLRRKQI
jgi:hypothetical protein